MKNFNRPSNTTFLISSAIVILLATQLLSLGAARTVEDRLPIPELEPSAICSMVLVNNSDSSSITLIDSASNQVVATLNMGGNPNFVSMHPGGTLAYIGVLNGINSSKVVEVNLREKRIKRSINLNYVISDMKLTPDGVDLVAVEYKQGRVHVIDRAKFIERGLITLCESCGADIRPVRITFAKVPPDPEFAASQVERGMSVVVALYKESNVYQLDLDSLSIKAQMPVLTGLSEEHFGDLIHRGRHINLDTFSRTALVLPHDATLYLMDWSNTSFSEVKFSAQGINLTSGNFTDLDRVRGLLLLGNGVVNVNSLEGTALQNAYVGYTQRINPLTGELWVEQTPESQGGIGIYDPQNFSLLGKISNSPQNAHYFRPGFSANGRYFYSHNFLDYLQVYDVQSRQRLPNVLQVGFSPRGAHAECGNDY